MVATLKRLPIIEKDNNDISLSFANEVKSKLGYNNLLLPIKIADEMKIFNEIGLMPFDTNSVNEYKKEKEKETGSNKILRFIASMLIFVLIACILGCFIGIVLAIIQVEFSKFVVFGSVILGILSFISLAISLSIYKIPTWERVSLQNYSNTVPEYALQTALDIKNLNNNVLFFVDHLTFKEIVLDPFLIVKFCDSKKEYYIEVWDELNFKQKRII